MTFQEFISKSYEMGVKDDDELDVLDLFDANSVHVFRFEDDAGNMKVRITDYPDDDDEDEDDDDFDDVFEYEGDIGDSK